MNDIAIYTLTSELHDASTVKAETEQFLSSLGLTYQLCSTDFSDYGQHPLDLIFVRTGGTESIFRRLLPTISAQSPGRPIYLLASHKNNSLAASIEILSYLQLHGMRGEIIHGTSDYVCQRILRLQQVNEAHARLKGMRLGIIGTPSDWLIASQADPTIVAERWGIELVELPIQEVQERFNTLSTSTNEEWDEICNRKGMPQLLSTPTTQVSNNIPDALRIYHALKGMVNDYRLNGLTLRCFDLLGTLRNTGCLALSLLNSEGIIASCEGDVPAMISMAIAQALTRQTGFQANPASIDPHTGEVWFAHCTIPFDMVKRFALDTHFESGIGVGIRGIMPNGPVTIFKTSTNEQKHYAAEGILTDSPSLPNLCRTQQVIRLSHPDDATYFLTHPIGNHHIILAGHHKALLDEMMNA